MTKRITPKVKAIADAHISARQNNKFDDINTDTIDQLKSALYVDGKTSEIVMKEIEIRFISITSCLMSSQLGYVSKAYRDGVYKGFKIFFEGYDKNNRR
jgi:hypothetical protein